MILKINSRCLNALSKPKIKNLHIYRLYNRKNIKNYYYNLLKRKTEWVTNAQISVILLMAKIIYVQHYQYNLNKNNQV
jgi:hypothetical protein